MNDKEQAKQRVAMLKSLREDHKETVARTQTLLKEQKKLQQQLCQVLREKPRTVPEVAQETGLPSDQFLWHITAMKKYGLILETGMCGDYYLYQLAKETTA
jgi:predicted transcriptional regulator